MPYKIVSGDGGYYVLSPHGHYLSHNPLTYEQAFKQSTAVRLSELRTENVHERPVAHHPAQSHTMSTATPLPARHHLTGSTYVPVSKDVISIPEKAIVYPVRIPDHELRKRTY